MTPDIYLSVVIPIRNEESFILDTLQTMADQEYPRDQYELIVVDGESTDRTWEVVEGFAKANPDVNVRLLRNPGRWSSRGRNLGARAARGKLIAVIDGHVHIPDRYLFRNMERCKEDNQALALARPAPLTVPGLDAGMARWIALARKSWLAHSRHSYIYRDTRGLVDPVSSGFAYDRAVFQQVGYFDEAFDAAEDVEFHYRMKDAGILAYTAPELTIFSYPRASLSGLFAQMVRYGVGRARLVRKHPAAFSKEMLVPPAILVLSVLAIIALVLVLQFPIPAIATLGLFSVYALTVLCTAYSIAKAERRMSQVLAPALAIWFTHLGLGWGIVSKIAVPRRRLFARPPGEHRLSANEA